MVDFYNVAFVRRAPRGARGLKFEKRIGGQNRWKSRPTRGAWIEIKAINEMTAAVESRPTRGAWIEIS